MRVSGVATSLGDLARAQLDDLLVPLGFQSGQGESGQIIFCAPQEVLNQHFPQVVFIAEQFPEGGGGCLDLIVEGTLSDGIASVRLEGYHLSELLTQVDLLGDAELAAEWPGESISADLVRIRRVMALLSDPTPTR